MRPVLCGLIGILASLTARAAVPPATYLLTSYPQKMADRYTARDGLPGKKVIAVVVEGDQVLVETEAGAAAFAGGKWTPLPAGQHVAAPLPPVDTALLPAGAKVLSAAKTPDGRLWVITDRGPFKTEGGRLVPLPRPLHYRTHQPYIDAEPVFTCVAADSRGHVWLGTNVGIFATDGADWWNPMDRRNGLPWEEVTCLALARNGDIWAGTTDGVCCCTAGGTWEYYRGPRWLPGNAVNAIAAAPDGSAWVATDGGVAHLYAAPMTLAKKAAHYEEITAARHNRYGFVTGSILKKPGDVNGGVLYEASDNDGLWTSLYVAAEAFRYAATHDPQARALAKKSMWAMRDLMRFSGMPGYPARAIFRKGEEVDGYDPNETVRVPGETDKIWYVSPVDPNVMCKQDTSSDETDGHYFAYSVFYDLVADDAEKAAIRENVRALTDNILNHDLTLVGPTGRKTLWGVWAPRYLNDDPDRWEDRGLNSLEILAYLKIAAHICGDPKYTAKYNELIERQHYLLNTVAQKVEEPWYNVNYSDDEMAYMMYYALMRLEQDPDTRRVLAQSLERSWKFAQPERSPFFDFVYGEATGRPCDVEGAVATLQEWPWELIDWRCDNSHRLDITLRQAAWEGGIKVEATTALPMSERQLMRWNGNPYEVSGGSETGADEEDGSAWLLPYWLGRYAGLIREAAR
ncbi:MAG TPA: hypothetical protein VKT32_04360 [Chthonomonadaceae bacterium]|nr:hypothetical protein [Chthonomonadaceae bacterium]